MAIVTKAPEMSTPSWLLKTERASVPEKRSGDGNLKYHWCSFQLRWKNNGIYHQPATEVYRQGYQNSQICIAQNVSAKYAHLTIKQAAGSPASGWQSVILRDMTRPARKYKFWDCKLVQSFWVFSEKKLGYSGVATYVRDAWSPVSVELDRLGTIDTDLNGEGRWVHLIMKGLCSRWNDHSCWHIGTSANLWMIN